MTKKLVRTAVLGAAGRMGQRIIDLILQTEGISLSAAIEQPGHPLLGKKFESKTATLEIRDDLRNVLPEVDVVIDFTTVGSTLSNLAAVAEGKKAVVIGTTGFSPAETECLREKLHGLRCVVSPNMSIGVNLLFNIVGRVARMVKEDFDVEITEMHHRMKKDAPSGTALRLAEIVAESIEKNLNEVGVYGRKGVVGERKPQEIGIHAIRAGDIVGEHTVLFAGKGERIEITHRAHSRDTFASGAIKAALWVVDQAPGIYTMDDVLTRAGG